MRSASLISVLALAALAGCNIPIPVDVPVGPLRYTVEATSITIPDLLRDPMTGTLRSIPCMNDMTCPQLGMNLPAVHCVSNACDPDPFTFDLPTDPIDLDELDSTGNVRRFGRYISRIELRAVRYAAASDGLTTRVGPTEIYWGPDNATAISPDQGVNLLGTIPEIDLMANPDVSGVVDMDPAGVSGLSNHFVNTSHRARFFIRPRVDLSPGQAIPSGRVTISMQMTVHLEGSIVR